MDWSKGFTSSFYASFVDPNTWSDDSFFDITGGSIQKSDDSLKESATIECMEYPYDEEKWVRVWMDTNQEGSSEHVPLFTGLAIYPSRSKHGMQEKNTLNCFSVLKPAEDILLQNGWYVGAGADVKTTLRKLLSYTKAPVEFSEKNNPVLTENILAEQGESALTMCWKIIDAIRWRMVIDGYGRITICPKATVDDISVTLDSLTYDVLETDLTLENDWYNSPNVLRVTVGEVTAVAKDEDPLSIYSIPNRGREIWTEERDVTLNSSETIGKYARNRLKELQVSTLKLSYSRRFNPDIQVTDLINIHYPEVNINGICEVSSQTITIGNGARTSEDVYFR